MRLFKRANSVDLVHDNDKKITEELGTPPEKAPASPRPAEPPSQTDVAAAEAEHPEPVAEGVAEAVAEAEHPEPVAEAARAEDQSATDKWVQETEKAVAQARQAGTPAVWRNVAEAAVVVAEMAQTMRVTTHATSSLSGWPERPRWLHKRPRRRPKRPTTRCGPQSEAPTLPKRRHERRRPPPEQPPTPSRRPSRLPERHRRRWRRLRPPPEQPPTPRRQRTSSTKWC